MAFPLRQFIIGHVLLPDNGKSGKCADSRVNTCFVGFSRRLCAGCGYKFYRAAFRITTDGRLIAVSSLADGDVHIGLDDKGFQARGNAALLRDLGEVWKELRGSLEEWLSIVFWRSMGMQAAEYIRLAADDAKRRWHDSFAPTQSEVDGFNRQTRDLQRKIDE